MALVLRLPRVKRALLIGLAIVLALVSFLLPREVTVTRSIVIDAPPEEVFPHIDSLQAFDKWSPWAGIDPAMQQSFSGPERGVGNRMEWSSDDPDVGSGSQEIIASEPDQRVESALEFGGMGVTTSWLALKPEGTGTRVTWGLQADMGASPVGRYMGLAMDRWVGPDFEAGLRALKALVAAS